MTKNEKHSLNKPFHYQRDFHNYTVSSSDNFDLAVMECGYEKCSPQHFFGPGSRNIYVLHYIVSGKGVFRINSQEYRLSAGDGFFFGPHDIVYYESDDEDPWTYQWVGFTGSKAKVILDNLSFAKSHIFHYTEDSFFSDQLRQMYEYTNEEVGADYLLVGQLYLFLGGLLKRFRVQKETSFSTDREYVDAALDFIKKNYSTSCTVMEISRNIGINRTYIYKLFIKYLGVSPTDYIEKFRINRACELLKTQNLLIMEVAAAVGYTDQFYFSRVFKKVIGMSPKEYIQHNINAEHISIE